MAFQDRLSTTVRSRGIELGGRLGVSEEVMVASTLEDNA